MLKRIAITGPESTGKSTLSRQLSRHYHTVWVSEYAVDYLAEYGPDYTLEDVLKMAKGQLEHENDLAHVATKRLFCDTDLLVFKIWCDVVFGEVPAWIEEQLESHIYDLYLLCSPDIPWRPGLFRENPNDREYLFQLYLRQLAARNLNYKIIEGKGMERLANALSFVDELTV
ncbi:MAG: ATP-binding protein [bacterium]